MESPSGEPSARRNPVPTEDDSHRLDGIDTNRRQDFGNLTVFGQGLVATDALHTDAAEVSVVEVRAEDFPITEEST